MNNFKRIMSMILLVIVATVAFGCTPKNDNIDDVLALVECRAQAIAEIESYAQSKGQDNYLEEDWIVIQEIIRDIKTAIQTSNSKDEIAGYVVSAKTDIDGMQTKQQKEAILKGIALIAELEKYAQSKGEDNYYAYNWGVIERIVEESKTSIESSIEFSAKESIVSEAKRQIDEVRTKIQEESGDLGPDPTDEEGLKYRALQWYAYKHVKAYEDLTMEECMKKVSFYTGFSKYYGCYNGCIVARFARNDSDVPCVAGDTYYIEGFAFSDPYRSIPIKVYKEGNFYLLTEAYELGLLTKDDIEIIHKYFQKGGKN